MTETETMYETVGYAYAQASAAIVSLSTLLDTLLSNDGNLSYLEIYEALTADALRDRDVNLDNQSPADPSFSAYAPVQGNEITKPIFPDLPYFLPGAARYMDLPDEIIDPSTIHAYASALLTQVKEKLLTRIKYGNTIWPETIQEDAFIRDDEQKLLALEEAREIKADEWAKRGFSLPNGILFKAFDDLESDYLNKKVEVSKDISFKMADLEQSNINLALKISLNLESQSMNMHIQHQGLILKSMEELQKARNEIYGLWTELYRIHNVDVGTYYSVLLEKAKIGVEINKELIERYGILLDGRREIMQAQMDRVVTLLRQYELDIKSYIITLDGLDIGNEVNVENTHAQNTVAVSNAKVAVKAGEIQSRVAITANDLNSSIAEAVAHCEAQISASIASIYGYSKSTGIALSSSISDTNSAKESHTYKEK